MVQSVVIKTYPDREKFRRYDIFLDGKNISKDVVSLDIHMEAGSIPQLTVTIPFTDLTIDNVTMATEVDQDDINHVSYTPEQCGYEK